MCYRRILVVAAALLLPPVASHATVTLPTSLQDLTASSARVVRARCIEARVETQLVATARLSVTRYTFDVADVLKGVAPRRLVFRQVGTPHPGKCDLGRLAGLPVYEPGVEYVLFLLPESQAGLTSPAGAAEGAYPVHGERVIGGSLSATSTSYGSFREAVQRGVGK